MKTQGIQISQVPQEGPLHPDRLPGMAVESVHAGFPSPAQDYMNPCIDLNAELVRHPVATYYGRVVGDSMIDAGVEEGDILVIDKSLDPSEGDMAVCFVDGEFTLKRISFKDPSTGKKPAARNGLWLLPANKSYAPIHVTEVNDFTVWGVVTYLIKKVK